MIRHASDPDSGELARKRAAVAGLYEGVQAVLSPMAGVTDLVFRAVCREHGADLTFCEFVSADGVVHGNDATRELMELGPDEHPVGIQLFGADPASLAEAARAAADLGPDIIDLNFGCPVRKIVKRNGGSALLCNLPLMDEIVRAVVAATDIPVTAKIRLGWSDGSVNYMETTRMLEEAGACAITIHGRTREQKFSGSADWGPIGEVKAAATVPIIGNGDVFSGADYLRLRAETGCDAVMIARAAIGNPFIFDEITAAMNGAPWQPPAVDRVVTTLLDHMQREIALKGPRTGLNRMKRHFASYLRGYPRVAELRKAVFASNDIPTIRSAFEDYRSAHAGIQIESAAPAGETVS
ncbi:tRNA dihydrouridine synthase DusB [bacterium]|nr:MAG: tRNA dihydrouridine synthase DusB [bacterium]